MRRRRLATVLASTALAAGTMLTTATPASADPNFTFSYTKYSSGSLVINVYTNGTHSGRAEFQADPIPDAVPGDAIRAQDSLDDGWGIKAIMTFPESREVSTSGHPSPYTTGWDTGDLEEGETVIMRACATKSGSSYCSPSYGGIA
ncbi:hypothetical protein RB196_35945 [Streptomyces sp. PmtA]|uniref:hypothetical protein n=1 Tax=Streptomyces sp. PmtA TaxID=3074275 RepID=UPI003014650A